jgi:hypothetical protein
VARIGCVAIAFLVVAGIAVAASSPDIPSALARTARPSDRLPSRFQALQPVGARPFGSRRIATHQDGKGRLWSVYVFKQVIRNRVNICVFTLRGGGGGGGCSPTTKFFGPVRRVVAFEGRLFAGVAADDVATVRLIGSHGAVHNVRLSRDHGFVYDCNAYNGCACLITRLQAFDKAGRLITDQDWRGSSCRRP